MRNKKGTIIDMFFIIIFIFMIAVVALLALKMWNEVTPELEPHLTEEAKQTIEKMEFVFAGYDFIVVFFFIGFYLATLLGAFLIDTHPALFFVSLLFLMAMGVVTAQLANAWEIISTNPEFVVETASLGMTDHLLRNFPLIAITMAMILLVVLYSKVQGGGAGGV